MPSSWFTTKLGYTRGFVPSTVFDIESIESRPGFISFTISGDEKAVALFDQEAGGHRHQRIPPTERKGRVHTSTITVAVLHLQDSLVSLDMKDVEIETTRGTGPGGQHRNTTDSCVVARHRPTKIQVRVDMRSQHQSRRMALTILAAKIRELNTSAAVDEANKKRKDQIGSGQRGDKIRTYRTQDDQVKDHRTGKRMSLETWISGRWNWK